VAGKRRLIDVELAELRRRAYGPEADIAADPAAQVRLRALEAREQQQVAASVMEQGASPGDSASPPENWKEDPTLQGSEDGARIAPPTIAFRRRLGPWMIAIAAMTLALVTGTALLATEISRPRAELTLTSRSLPADVIVPGISTATLQSWGIPPGALTYHGRVGALDVWTMTDGRDAECLILSADGSFYRQSCGRRPLQPQIDIVADSDLIPSGSIDPVVPRGSTVRIGVFEGAVRIFIARPRSGD
jgi:hypothetical protein